MIRVYAFDWVPPFAKGLVRDLRVRWALEEAGLDYESITIDHQDKNEADYRALQPFGQVRLMRRHRRKAGRRCGCSNPAPSCSISASAARPCCPGIRRRAPGRSSGYSQR